MRLKECFITHEIDGIQIMLPTGNSVFHGMIQNNKTAAFIVQCLKNNTTKEQIVEAMLLKYDAPRELIEHDVERFLNELRAISALEE